MIMSSKPWTRSELLELLTLIAMIIISTIAAAWHILMNHRVSIPAKLHKEAMLISYLRLSDPATDCKGRRNKPTGGLLVRLRRMEIKSDPMM
jgi:hypothetical protein